MSLLLDALKRAEEAKRAKGQEGPGGGAGASKPSALPVFEELSLEDYAAAPVEDLSRPPIKASKLVLDSTRELSTGNESVQPASTPPASPARIRTEPTPSLSPARLIRQDFSLKGAAESSADDSAQRDVAKNVFAAKQPAPTANRPVPGKWLLPLIAFLIVGVGGAGWYVWNEVTRVNRGATPSLAGRQASAPNAALPPLLPTTGQAIVGAKAADAAPTAPTAVALPPLLPPPAKETALPRRPMDRPLAIAGRSLSERERLAQSLKDSSLRASKEAPVSLKLSQNINPPRVNPDVLAAYAALGKGDYAQAKQRYERVVQAEPFNLDAHLGLAAAAARSGENSLAARHYRRALEIDPRSGAALSGMLAISSCVNSQALEIELRTLIDKDPGSAALQFSLGNVYATDRRWSEAQQAYFEAYRLESENADYRFNLAVALDQMKQSKLALDYYQKALSQYSKSGGQFDRAAVQRRIAELKSP